MRARRTSWTGVASPTTGSWESGGENQARPSRAFSDDYVLVGALLLLTGVRMSAYGHSPDPRVAYASFWGGSGAEGREPTVGRDGSIYVTWGTDSPNLPRIGRGSRPYQGQEDGYIAKLDRTGTRIIYATYLGSPGNDEIDSAGVDASGHLYVTGFATDGFPTTPGALDPTFNGAADCCDGLFGDAFIAKLSTDGSRLLYSTFLGGSGPTARAPSPSAATAASRSVASRAQQTSPPLTVPSSPPSAAARRPSRKCPWMPSPRS